MIDSNPAEPTLSYEFNSGLLKAIINGLTDPIFVKNRQHSWIFINDAFCDLMGCSQDEIIGKSGLELSPKKPVDLSWENEEQVFKTGLSYEIEEYLTDSQGESYCLYIKKSLIQDEAGNPFLLGSIKRILQANQTEAELRESKQFLQLVMDSIPQLIFWKDRNFVYLGCNQYAARAAGFNSPEEMVGKTDEDLPSTEEEANWFRECDRRVMESDTPEDGIVEPCLQADGKVLWIKTNKIPLHDAQGTVIGILATSEDITDLVETQEKLKQINQELEQRVCDRTAELEKINATLETEILERQRIEIKLRESQQLLQLVLDNIPQSIFWKDCHSVYLGCNYRFATVAGVGSPENIAGKTDYDLAWKPEEAAWFRECDRRVMTSDTPENGIIEPQQQADGKQAWLETNKIPLHDSEGHVVGILGTFQDISSRKHAEAALQQSETELRQKAQDLEQTLHELQRTQSQLIQSEKMSSLGQLVAGIAHEINNPVNFIYGNLIYANNYIEDLMHLMESYQEYYPHPAPALQAEIENIDLDFLRTDFPKLLTSMQVGAERIRAIVSSLRTFSRLDEAAVKAVDLHEGIDSTLMILQSRLKSKPQQPNIQIIKEYGKLPLVECYAVQINQVFMNILNNAIDALDELNSARNIAGIPAHHSTIIIGTEMVVSDRVMIRITDNGPGIPPPVQQRVFDPFFTTKPVGKGTGLGLSISYQIVQENHRGSLSLNSELGKGTTFIVEIPIRHQK